MNVYSQACAVSISDELQSSNDAISVLINYANNPRTIKSHEVDSDTPRLTLATENGTVFSIWPTKNNTFSIDISFEDASCENGRFRVKHNQVTFNIIEDLVGENWCDIELLRNWQPKIK
jgi:hypothetical protein